MRHWIGTAAAAALLAGGFAPAEARDWHRHHDHDDGVGDVVAGAIVVGGIAAIASAISHGNREKEDAAVDGCAHEAESRTGGRIADIGHVGKSKGYYTVEGALDAAPASDGGPPAHLNFTCTIRSGAIYSFHASPPPEAGPPEAGPA
jgi:hypothetical protein